MTFELAAVVALAVVAIGLGLVCYHLLGRLEMLERAVQGGLEPPTTRLSREQFELRFRTAHARSNLAAETGTGLVLVVGPEYADSELARTVAELPRADLLTLTPATELPATDLGIGTTPYLFVIDDSRIRAAQPVASSADVADVLNTFG